MQIHKNGQSSSHSFMDTRKHSLDYKGERFKKGEFEKIVFCFAWCIELGIFTRQLLWVTHYGMVTYYSSFTFWIFIFLFSPLPYILYFLSWDLAGYRFKQRPFSIIFSKNKSIKMLSCLTVFLSTTSYLYYCRHLSN